MFLIWFLSCSDMHHPRHHATFTMRRLISWRIVSARRFKRPHTGGFAERKLDCLPPHFRALANAIPAT